ncbi:DNA-directed RNA polymerase subunit alpha [Candidatus Karelsulcia muelleri]|uniref:DNA-directed RNA polymerase subunit alpha n=1 Tax=Candidatus Karelsulcia muelleri TaxID=336810 RepID=UPI00237B00B0|nr:DNA-directed RNA polymerase subunit alpha [Candidatus Karelsulcia muelleri]WDR79114.1 DNA-directed RNA polymerase subunit alpha [Candidatus Karelsulcia muelleri]
MIISPAQIKVLKNSNNIGKFLIKPLSPGFGITIGNALRRVLISYLEGYAIYYIMINGIKHEFSYVDGVIENITEIILNLKKIRFKLKSKRVGSNNIPKHYTIFFKTKKEQITAGDLCGSLTYFEVLNPKLLILKKELDTNLNITIGIKKGVGYVPVEKNKYFQKKRGKIPIDTIFSPIINVRFKVENCEVHNSYEYDSLILEIITDGSITPQNAFKKASSILIQHFTLFFNGKNNGKKKATNSLDSKERIQVLYMQKVLNSKLSENVNDLSVRTLNCLKFAKIRTWADLVKFKTSDLLKVRNFGMKSFDELNKKMKKLGLSYGMDLSKYKIKIYNKKQRIINFREKMRQIVKLRNILKLRKMMKKNDTQK